MHFTIIDYSDRYFSGTGMNTLPARYDGKFVQLRSGSSEYLVLSPKGFMTYHANIVDYFCQEHGIGGTLEQEQGKFIINNPSWSVKGGGKFEIDRDRRLLRLYDNSMAYGRFDSSGLKEKVRGVSEFAAYDVRIE